MLGTRAFAWIALFGAVGCTASAFDGRVYSSSDMKFRVGPVPSSWRAIDADPARLAFRDPDAQTTVMINGRCGRDGDDVPLQALTQHLFLHFTERQVRQQELFELDRREALRTRMSAKLDGVEKHFVAVVLKKDGCVYDFLQIAGVPDGQESREFDAFVAGFSVLEAP